MNPNGNTPHPLRGVPAASMTPEERKSWLKAKGAPPDMMLISVSEFIALTKGIANGNAQLAAHKLALRACAEALGDKLDAERSLPENIAAAVFDAAKNDRAFKKLDDAFTNAINTLTVVCALAEIPFAAKTDLLNARANLADALLAGIAEQESKWSKPAPAPRPK